MRRTLNARPLLLAVLLAMLLALGACRPAPPPSGDAVKLQALPPISLSFPTAQGEGRNDYFFVEAPRRSDAGFQAALRAAVDAEHAKLGGARAVHSIYVYERTAVLNAGFTGAASDLKGVHDGSLVSYSRWTAGSADIFYLIDGGQVVFDLLKNAPVKPPFEFD